MTGTLPSELGAGLAGKLLSVSRLIFIPNTSIYIHYTSYIYIIYSHFQLLTHSLTIPILITPTFIPILLTALTKLSLYKNQFTGSLSSQLGLLTNLQHLDFGSNSLSGPIPRLVGPCVSVCICVCVCICVSVCVSVCVFVCMSYDCLVLTRCPPHYPPHSLLLNSIYPQRAVPVHKLDRAVPHRQFLDWHHPRRLHHLDINSNISSNSNSTAEPGIAI